MQHTHTIKKIPGQPVMSDIVLSDIFEFCSDISGIPTVRAPYSR